VAEPARTAYIRDGMAFDTLTYARRLKEAGFSDRQAEALAEATRDLAVQDFATKSDIAALKADIAALEQRFTAALDTLGLRLTVRMGGLVAIGVAALAALIKL
jgi:hypothetical protein